MHLLLQMGFRCSVISCPLVMLVVMDGAPSTASAGCCSQEMLCSCFVLGFCMGLAAPLLVCMQCVLSCHSVNSGLRSASELP